MFISSQNGCLPPAGLLPPRSPSPTPTIPVTLRRGRARRLSSLLLALAAACCARASLAQRAGRDAGLCRVREVSRFPLALADGRHAYVEPQAVAASAGRVLVAGSPSYLWNGARGAPTRDSIFGVVLAAGGSARAIPSPVPARLVLGARALGRGDGGWDVAFVEMEPGYSAREDASAPVARLRAGVYDGRAWRGLETLPATGGWTPDSRNPSALVRTGEGLAWAVPVTRPGGAGVAVFERRGGRWTVEVVPTGVASGYPALAWSARDGLLLAVVRADPAARSDVNSLFLYRRRPRWTPAGLAQRGGAAPIHFPTLTMLPDGPVATWWSVVQRPAGLLREARTAPLRPGAVPVTLDSTVSAVVPVAAGPAGLLWVTGHAGPGLAPELRFVRVTERGAASVGRIPDPYRGEASAVSPAPGEVLVLGPVLDPSPDHPSLVTLFIRVRVDCSAARR